MSALRSYAPMRRVSKKVTKAAPDFRAVYKVVDARSGGRCECNLLPPNTVPYCPPMLCRDCVADKECTCLPGCQTRRANHSEALARVRALAALRDTTPPQGEGE